MSLAEKIVDKMYQNDPFSQWLGVERILVEEGKCTLQMVVRKEMANGFGQTHGGITYSLADSAFAFASNSHGRKSVSIETSISHTAAVRENDVLTAVAGVNHLSNKLGVYSVVISNQEGVVVGLFKGTVYRTGEQWEV